MAPPAWISTADRVTPLRQQRPSLVIVIPHTHKHEDLSGILGLTFVTDLVSESALWHVRSHECAPTTRQVTTGVNSDRPRSKHENRVAIVAIGSQSSRHRRLCSVPDAGSTSLVDPLPTGVGGASNTAKPPRSD